MRFEKEVTKLFTRRMLVIGAFKSLLFTSIIGRLFYLQILHSKQFSTLSDKNRIRLKTINPQRGIIYDRHQNSLVVNKTYYKLMLDTSINKNFDKLVNQITEILKLDPTQFNLLQYNIKKPAINGQLLIIDNISWENLTLIEINNTDLPGVYIESAKSRYYPFAHLCSHMIGYVSSVSQEDESYEKLKRYDIKVGKSGVEKTYDAILRGSPGYQQIEVDAYGNLIRELDIQEATNGNGTHLALNLNYQQFASDLLADKAGAIVALNCINGEIVAMCSSPNFNPNILSQGVTQGYWNEIINNKSFPLINKAISRTIPAGSIFKLIVGLAALESGISPTQRFECNGTITYGNHVFHCWKQHRHGPISLQNAIQHSCNIYFYQVARIIGIAKISEIANKLGLGNLTNIDLGSEVKGIIPTRQWKKARYKQEWTIGDTIISSIGHGYILVTPIQLALMTARIASGLNIKPHCLLNKNEEPSALDLNPKHLEIIREAMYGVANKPGGTAYYHRAQIPQHEFAAKTGTAQVIKIQRDASGKAMDNRSYDTSHHGICIGFGPYQNPKYACAVLFEHGGSGGAAAPLLSKMLQHMFKES